MRHGAFAIAVSCALAFKHGQVLVEGAFRPIIFKKIKHFYKSIVSYRAAVFGCGSIQFIGDIADRYDARFVHFRIGALYGIEYLILGDVAKLHYIPQEREQTGARVHAAAHVG